MFGKKIALIVSEDDYNYLVRVSKRGFRHVPESLRLLIANARQVSETSLSPVEETKSPQVAAQATRIAEPVQPKASFFPPSDTQEPTQRRQVVTVKAYPFTLPSVLRGRPGRAKCLDDEGNVHTYFDVCQMAQAEGMPDPSREDYQLWLASVPAK